eukprot:CAMPEP_0196728040 /NCGR_PEP_ID=MMETSP1091-20130531/8861_1 /TAXON_ID=302021 /ORGANISM="Rhodomonas sp., Strain CCMP768" /LENGTH=381 /DNA_ID=CAMNT_0042070739 /DNA_START=1 /DNA_END=1146 /DNA_ORIENTATION=+
MEAGPPAPPGRTGSDANQAAKPTRSLTQTGRTRSGASPPTDPFVTRYTVKHPPPAQGGSLRDVRSESDPNKVIAYNMSGGSSKKTYPLMVMGLDGTSKGSDQDGDSTWRQSVISINRQKRQELHNKVATPRPPGNHDSAVAEAQQPGDSLDTKNDLVAGYMASPPLQAQGSSGPGRTNLKSSASPPEYNRDLLDRDLVILSTGTSTKEERVSALTKISKRIRNQADRADVLQAGLVAMLNGQMQDTETIPSSIMALLSLITDPEITDLQWWDDTPGSYPHLLRIEIERHNIIERLVALLCWSLLADRLKGEIARILLNLSKNGPMADRVMQQDGALRALSVLLDSDNEACASLAAAALANISYWSTEGPRLMARLQVLCAV